MSKFIRFTLPFALLIAGVFIFYQLKSSEPAVKPNVVSERDWPVEAVKVDFQDLNPSVKLYGVVESPRQITLRSALMTDVTDITILSGEKVSINQHLVSLDDLDVTLTLAQREAELHEIKAKINSEFARYKNDQAAWEQEKILLSLAQSSLERAQKLAKTQLGSQVNVENAEQVLANQKLIITNRQRSLDDHPQRLAQLESHLKKANAQKKRVEHDLDRVVIDAPFDGRVTDVYVSKGDRVHPGDPLLKMFDTSFVEVKAQIPNRYIAELRRSLDKETNVTAETKLNNRSYLLYLNRVSAQVNPGDGGVNAYFHFLDSPSIIELGRTLSLRLSMPLQYNVFALPATAIYGADTIYKIENGRLEPIRIERVGGFDKTQLQSWSLFRSSELKNQDLVLSSQAPNAVRGLKVKIISTQDSVSK